MHASPFPVLHPRLSSPLFVFGTASLLGINAATRVPDASAAVLDAILTASVRRVFAAHEPGDWNIPLVDPDADQISRVAPATFAVPATGLTRAVAASTHGYASWSYLAPAAEHVVITETRALAEARLSPRNHLRHLDADSTEATPGLD